MMGVGAGTARRLLKVYSWRRPRSQAHSPRIMDSFAFWTAEQISDFFDSVPDPYPESFLFGHLWSDAVAKTEPVLNAQKPQFSLSPWLNVDMSPYFRTEGMAASQADGDDGAGEVLTHELPTESAVHMPNEAPEEMTVAERDCTSGRNSDECSTLDVPSEAPADTRTESEAVVTPRRTPTGDGKAAGPGGDYEFDSAINRDTPLSTLGEVDSLTRGNTRQRSGSEARGEPITGPSSDGRAEAPSATLGEDGKATAQGLALATSCEAPSNPQHEAMCARQPATSESPPDPAAEKEKAAVAQEAVKPRLDDRPGIRAGELEEGTDPGSPPVMLPDVDEMSRTEAAQAEYELCAAAFIYIFITRHSENGESTQDRDSATDEPSAAVLCNSDSPEDAERGEMENSTDETITVCRTEQTCRPSDQGNLERGSQGTALDQP
ncbi:hypothetical protein BDW02DRAFT_240097 [Decorospora gaudefroyi]|uniref:Uncharacterized protein n=1 Tax=Decorospora gaudefroyi TaxID=184978 RepID=A0A6A5JWY8_9PLEO|nr:hypothetical protein BDW02DRAFT_240097 [Decorospora gaudefroyi]